MKFSTADKDFCWLSGNIFRILYPKYISDPATGNAVFLAQWSSCWSEFHIQNHKLCSCFTSVCLYLEKITFFRGCSSSVSWIFFLYFWLYCGRALDSLSLFSMTSFPFYFPTSVKLSDAFLPSYQGMLQTGQGMKFCLWPSRYRKGRAALPLTLKGQIEWCGMTFLLPDADGTLM